MLLKDLPPALRPREKLLTCGPQALSDAELLALLLRTGLKGQSVLHLAESLLERFGGLSGLLHATGSQLAGVPGLGPARRAELAAILEMARRSWQERLQKQPVFESPAAVQDYLRLRLSHQPREVFGVMFLDAQHRLIAFEELFQGTLTQTSVHPREVVRRALALQAAAVILAHNHPSGHPQPSRADELVTQTLRDALALVDVRVLDHVVVAGGHTVSFCERGLM